MGFPKVVEKMFQTGLIDEDGLSKLAKLKADLLGVETVEEFSKVAQAAFEADGGWTEESFHKAAAMLDSKVPEVEMIKDASFKDVAKGTLLALQTAAVAAVPTSLTDTSKKGFRDSTTYTILLILLNVVIIAIVVGLLLSLGTKRR